MTLLKRSLSILKGFALINPVLQFTHRHSHAAVAGADVKKTLPMVFMFLASTGVIALTGNPFIVFLWLLTWYLSSRVAGKSKTEKFLVFFLGLWFLYPRISLDYRNFHQKGFVLGIFLVFFFYMCRKEIIRTCKEYRFVKIMIVLWVGWGLLAYLPVLFASVAKYGLAERLPDYLDELAVPTTLMKTTVYIIPNALAILVPIQSLKKPAHLQIFVKTIFILMLLVIAGAFETRLFDLNLANQDYSMSYALSNRMHTFSVLHPNGFGRLLLMPLILFISLSFKSLRPHWIIIVGAGLFCVLLTFTRTTYVSLAVGVLMVILANSFRLRGVFMAILLSIMVVAFVNYLALPELFQTDARLSSQANMEGRFYLHKIALEIIADNPYFGSHPGGYQRALFANGYPSNRETASAHNMFLGIAVIWGVPMAIILLMALLATIWNGFRMLKKLANTSGKNNEMIKGLAVFCIALPVAYLVHGMMEIVPPEFVFFVSGVSFALSGYVEKYS